MAYDLDQAVFIFGTALQAELEGVEAKKKQERKQKMQAIIQKWIPEASNGKKRYRDPAQRGMA